MNELKVFQNSEFGEFGVLLIDGKEYFPATACAKILGYVNPYKAVKDHCAHLTKREGVSFSTNQHGITSEQKATTNYIPEGDLYRLIIRSKLPAAERFERWVFDEVLPAIRKQGTYIPSVQIVDIIQQTATAVVAEVVRQLVPVIVQTMKDSVSDEDDGEEICTTTIISEKKRRRRNTPGKIESLPSNLQHEVVRMLKEDATYLSVTQFLARRGYHVSQMSVSRYYNKAFN